MLVCVFLCLFAHETAGAARTRLSLRPLVVIEGGNRRKARAHRAARMRTHILSLYDNCIRTHTHVVPQAARPKACGRVADATEHALHRLGPPRGSACVAWMKRSEIRGLLVDIAIPDCAALHPGYSSDGWSQRVARMCAR